VCTSLQCVVVCCSVLTLCAMTYSYHNTTTIDYTGVFVCTSLQCVAVCCSVLQCVAVCCSVLQCVDIVCLDSFILQHNNNRLHRFVCGHMFVLFILIDTCACVFTYR